MSYIRNKKGFSFVEVLISIVLLSIGILGVAKISTSVIRGNSLTSLKTKGALIAMDKVEELISLDFSDPQLTDDGASGDLNEVVNPDHINVSPDTAYAVGDNYPQNTMIDAAGAAGTSDSIFTRFWNIEDTASNLKTITVHVTWSDLYGSHTFSVTTLKSL